MASKPAEYKQVTVLSADVVHSMDIAAAVGAERLRELMAELLDRSTAVVNRYGGTVDKFTGDGIMALFGAPVALEDHAVRACLAALDIQRETEGLAAQVSRDGITLQLRIGLNSGQVIAGEIGSGPFGYTAVGEQVGMAQRMESVAPPGGVMLSDPTARLVADAAVLGEPEIVHIKGAADPVPARRLTSMADDRDHPGRIEPTLVGRTWELNTITGILDEAIDAAGCVVGVLGPPGIGKSRIVRESAGLARRRGVEVFTTYCESHTTDIPFHAIERLLRAGFRVTDLDPAAARARIRTELPNADPEDLLMLDDLLGIADPAIPLPAIEADARRRRLTALVNTASLARQDPALYVIEDAHWIDDVSDSMLADFLAVIPQTHSMVLVTYRPEYRGALAKAAGGQSITLRPLSGVHTAALIGELLGTHPTVGGLAEHIAQRAAGNPFFAEEVVRDLAERGVLHGERGAYSLRGAVSEVNVPPTLQATIGARIDRLSSTAKRTLNAAAVVGARFDADLLTELVDAADVTTLIEAELVDQVRFTPRPEYAFRHPMIRTVAYESQLKSDRAQLHRRLAEKFEQSDENAALIAEHLDAAGDLHEAYAWHMRAGTWLTNRDIAAAYMSWRRAQQVADRLPEDDPNRLSMRIAPRTLLCASAFRVGGPGLETGFDEVRDLCTAAGDQRSLAVAMVGQLMTNLMNLRKRDASRIGSELGTLLESIGDSTLTMALSVAALAAKYETGEMAEVLRLAQHVIDLADDDSTKGNLIVGSPLVHAIASRGFARACLGMPSWQDDLCQSIELARGSDPMMLAGVVWYAYAQGIAFGMVLADGTALSETAETFTVAAQSGDDLALDLARMSRGIALIHRDGPERKAGLGLIVEVRQRSFEPRILKSTGPFLDVVIAQEKARSCDFGGAIELSRAALNDSFDSGGSVWIVLATSVLVEALLQRGGDGDLKEAQAAVDRLAAVPTDPGFVLNEIWLLRLRAFLARARGDERSYRDFRNRYLKVAIDLGFEGHMAMAEAML